MAGPSWLALPLAVIMIATAIYCAGRLAAACLWRRSTEIEADSLHVVMGVAMAGMLLPRLSPLPATAWQGGFGAAAAWFACQAVRGRRHRDAAGSRWRHTHPVPHLVESVAMVYMLAVLPGSWPGWSSQGMAMPAMGGRAAAGGSLLALAVILGLFMIGYVLWTADQLTALVRATAVATSGGVRDQSGIPVSAAGPSGGMDMQDAASVTGAVSSGAAYRPSSAALAPRLAACYKIAMGLTMGYMLIMML